MKLNAILTTGWDYKEPPGLTAKKLHQEACTAKDYNKSLSSQLKNCNDIAVMFFTLSLLIKKSLYQFVSFLIKGGLYKFVSLLLQDYHIYYFDELFRKRTRGFDDIKKLVGALTTIEDNKKVNCHIDAFAYSFLKGAKNFDLLLPFDKEQNNDFLEKYKTWSIIISNLEIFERTGKPYISEERKQQYLNLRKIVSRSSARDEIRTLATLLVSGPSTLKEVSKDLGLNYTLGQRTIGVFVNIGVVEKREHIIIFILSLLIKTKLSQPVSLLLQNYQEIYAILLQNYQEIYAISNEALPVVIFCLRETTGLDLLSNLEI